MPWANRPQLSFTLARNAAVFAACDAEVIISNCGDAGRLDADVAA